MNEVHFSSKSDNWETPQKLFDALDLIYNFDVDVCADSQNTKCKEYYSKNGLEQNWHEDGYTIWMNPPYGRQIGQWVKKAYEESLKGCFVVCLLPARTDTAWFHDYCTQGDITFIRGRLTFSNAKSPAPFPSMLVMFGLKPIIQKARK